MSQRMAPRWVPRRFDPWCIDCRMRAERLRKSPHPRARAPWRRWWAGTTTAKFDGQPFLTSRISRPCGEGAPMRRSRCSRECADCRPTGPQVQSPLWRAGDLHFKFSEAWSSFARSSPPSRRTPGRERSTGSATRCAKFAASHAAIRTMPGRKGNRTSTSIGAPVAGFTGLPRLRPLRSPLSPRSWREACLRSSAHARPSRVLDRCRMLPFCDRPQRDRREKSS